MLPGAREAGLGQTPRWKGGRGGARWDPAGGDPGGCPGTAGGPSSR